MKLLGWDTGSKIKDPEKDIKGLSKLFQSSGPKTVIIYRCMGEGWYWWWWWIKVLKKGTGSEDLL